MWENPIKSFLTVVFILSMFFFWWVMKEAQKFSVLLQKNYIPYNIINTINDPNQN